MGDDTLYTPLHWSCQNGHHEAVKAALAAVGGPEACERLLSMRDSTPGAKAPLHRAFALGHHEAVEAALAALGVAARERLLALRCAGGRTPLDYAYDNSHQETVAAALGLMDAGAQARLRAPTAT